MAISKNHPEFVRFANAVLAQMRTDGAWQSIYARWLGRFAPTPAPPAAHYSG
jgi:polar amino acid transport system substrate-binding protein